MRNKLLLLITVMALLFSACSSDFDSATDAVSDAAEGSDFESPAAAAEDAMFFDGDAEVEAFEEEAMADEATAFDTGDNTTRAQSGTIDTPIAQQLPDLGRDIIYTAHLEIASTDIAAATTQAVQAVERNGGIVFSQDTRGGRSGSSVLVFKVLPEQFQATLADLGSVGTVRGQSVNAEDVSALVVDLQSRIATNEASVDRLRDLLADADSVEVVARLESQLLDRETTLERLRGQLRTVRNQVDLATITVTITELLNRPGLGVELVSYAGHDDGFSCFDGPRTARGEAGDPITLCYRITNVGDTLLTDVSIDDEVLTGLTPVTVTGSLDSIDLGENAVVAYEIEIEESVRLRSSVTATAIDADGNPLPEPATANAQALRLDLVEVIDNTPGFGDVLSNSLRTIAAIALWLALALVAIAPFALIALVLFPVVRFGWRWLAARRPERPKPPAPPAPAAPPAPTAEDLVKADAAVTE